MVDVGPAGDGVLFFDIAADADVLCEDDRGGGYSRIGLRRRPVASLRVTDVCGRSRCCSEPVDRRVGARSVPVNDLVGNGVGPGGPFSEPIPAPGPLPPPGL